MNGYRLWNGTGGTNQACIRETSSSDGWKCFFAPYVFRFIQNTRVFVLNSLYDSAQISGIFRLGCNPDKQGNCSKKQLDELQQYRDDMVKALDPVIKSQRDGIFATACYQHEESCQDFDWDGIHVNNVSQRQAFGDWYFNRTQPAHSKYIDVRWPDNQSCKLGVIHGPC